MISCLDFSVHLILKHVKKLSVIQYCVVFVLTVFQEICFTKFINDSKDIFLINKQVNYQHYRVKKLSVIQYCVVFVLTVFQEICFTKFINDSKDIFLINKQVNYQHYRHNLMCKVLNMEITKENKLLIRKYIHKKKSAVQNNAEINKEVESACSKHDVSNTVLYMIIQEGDEDIVMYFLQNGAHFISNKDNISASLALNTNTTLGKDIMKLLAKQNVPVPSKAVKSVFKKEIVPEQRMQPYKNNNNISRAVSVQEISYPKRAGTSGVSGQFYETKLLSLVVHRALHDKDIKEFYLAANIKDIGDFDDVCFRYGNVACFMQTKHRENTDKAKLTVASVRSTTGKLGLGIYYDSFLKIRQKFTLNASDPMFYGKFENIDSYFVLYTPLKESFERKLPGQNQICSKLHNIIFTGVDDKTKNTKSIDMFQFDYEERDLDFLTKFIKDEHMKTLGKVFLEFILSNNKLEVMMANDLIKMYHPALAHKVILVSRKLDTSIITKPTKNVKVQKPSAKSTPLFNPNVPTYINKGTFRSEFFYTEDNNLRTLRNTLYKEIVFTHASKVDLPKEEIIHKINEIIANPCATTISHLIGSPIKFDEVNDKLILDINKLPKNKFEQDEIQQIKYDLQKVQVTRAMVRDAVYLAGQYKLRQLEFQLPLSFGNIDLTINKKTKNDVEDRLDFLVDKFCSLINHFADRNKNKEIKIIDISDDVVGPGEILEFTHLNSNGGIGGAVGNLLEFDPQNELFSFNTTNTRMLRENSIYLLNKLKEKTGEDLSKYQINVLIDGFPRVSFDVYQYDKKIAAEFFSKLWFYTNQAQEESVEQTIKTEINKYYNADKQRQQFLFHVHSDAIFLRFHDEIQKWWKRQTEASYLTKSTLIYEKAKKDIVDNPLITVLNVMFIRQIKQLGIEFDDEACSSLNEFTETYSNKILNIVSDAVILSAVKLMQIQKYRNNYSFINLDYVHILPSNDYQTMMEELAEIKNMTLVIISETPLSEGIQDTFLKVLNCYNKSVNNIKQQIIIITSERLNMKEIPVFKNYGLVKKIDYEIDLEDLTNNSRKNILDKYTITFQGREMKLNAIIDKSTAKLINSKLLWSIINKHKFEIGHTLSTQKYDEIKDYFIPRKLNRNDEEYEVDTLLDLAGRVILVSGKPGMGKTTLLTHLALQTKKLFPKVWIVQINISAHNKDFEALKSDDVNHVIPFLCRAALKKPEVINRVRFSKIDDERIRLTDYDCGDDIPFELALFIHCYNMGNIVFVFDGFDTIYPLNTNEGMNLLTAIHKAKKRMWITSNSYVIAILEDKFGPAYKLDRLPTTQQNRFLQRFWTTNLELEKLNHDQCNNLMFLCNYILKLFKRKINFDDNVNERPIMPMLSVPIHIIYLTILDYFKDEVHNFSPHYFRTAIREKWNFDSYTRFDRFMQRPHEDNSHELAGIPLHMYVAANYFSFQITDKFNFQIDTKTLRERSNIYIDAVTLYKRFLKVNMKNICEIETYNDFEYQNKLRDEFLENHKKIALYAICKENDVDKFLTEPEIRKVKETMRLIETGEIRTELIDSVVDGIPRFDHLVFAEYFLIEVLSDLINRVKNNDFSCNLNFETIWDFAVNVALSASPESLRNTFEYKLNYDPEYSDVVNDDNSKKIKFKLQMKQGHNAEGSSFDVRNAQKTAIDEGLAAITDLCLKGIRKTVDEDKINRCTTILKSSADILEAAGTSKIDKSVLRCMQKVDGETIVEALNSNPVGDVIHEQINTKIVEPIMKLTNKVVEYSCDNENLVTLVTTVPLHLVNFVRQFYNK